MASWHTLAPLFAVPASRETLAREILQQIEEDFHAILAIDDPWSVALSSLLATRTDKPMSVATITENEPVNGGRSHIAHLSIDRHRFVQMRQDLSWSGLDVVICIAWISEATIVHSLANLLASVGAQTKAVVCIKMDRTPETLALRDHFKIIGRSLPKISPPAVQKKPAKASNTRKKPFWEHRFWQARGNANEPCEDRITWLSEPRMGIQLFAVVDGHGGAIAAEYLEQHLLPQILNALAPRRPSKRHYYSVDDVRRAISQGFAVCDTELLNRARQHRYPPEPEPEPEHTPVPALPAQPATQKASEEEQTDASDATPSRPKRTKKIVPTAPSNSLRYMLHQSARTGACAVVAAVVTQKNGSTTIVSAHVGDCRAVVIHGLKSVQEGESFHKRMTEDISSQDSNKSTEIDSSDNESNIHMPQGQMKRQRRDADADVTDSVRSSNEEQEKPSVTVMTKDHTNESESEATAVIARSADPKPFRPSENDIKKLGRHAPVRVAGSLAVTRAFGDAYLKDRELSCMPFEAGCPYITAEPDINTLNVTEQHDFLILASDGLWELIAPDDLPDLFRRMDWERAVTTPADGAPSLGDRLLRITLDRAALRQGISFNALSRIPPGPKKREIHDDISILIVDLDHTRRVASDA